MSRARLRAQASLSVIRNSFHRSPTHTGRGCQSLRDVRNRSVAEARWSQGEFATESGNPASLYGHKLTVNHAARVTLQRPAFPSSPPGSSILSHGARPQPPKVRFELMSRRLITTASALVLGAGLGFAAGWYVRDNIKRWARERGQ